MCTRETLVHRYRLYALLCFDVDKPCSCFYECLLVRRRGLVLVLAAIGRILASSERSHAVDTNRVTQRKHCEKRLQLGLKTQCKGDR